MRVTLLITTLVFMLAPAASAGWEEDLDRVLTASPGEDREKLIGQVVGAAKGWEEIAARIQARSRPE